MQLKNEQQRLYDLVTREQRCFVRVCDDDRALWVCDLPRKTDRLAEVEQRLQQEGFSVTPDEGAKLWYIDWTKEKWEGFLSVLPEECPALPSQDAYHEAYALCRLWMMHPASIEKQHMPVIRRVAKLSSDSPSKMLSAVRTMHENSAEELRKGNTMPYAAGRILAAWLYQFANGKGTQP